MTVFSFHPVKSITTGEGGMITTNSEELYNKLLKLRSHGIQKNGAQFQNLILGNTNGKPNTWYYEMDSIGYHYRMTEMQAALGYSQMKKIDKFINKRKELAARYDRLTANNKYFKPIQKNARMLSANHLYPIQIDFIKINKSRNEVMLKLRESGVITQVHYLPIPLHPYYEKLGYSTYSLPNSMNFYFQILSLPIYPKLNKYRQNKVLKRLEKILSE